MMLNNKRYNLASVLFTFIDRNVFAVIFADVKLSWAADTQ